MSALPAIPYPDEPADRERIMAAAQELYLQHGIATVALADFADHVGLPESRVTHLFSDKEPLVWAVVNELSYVLHAKLSEHKERSDNAVEELLILRDSLRNKPC
ncbi:TetR/AcrR family transcriptional regulator [Hymenobacter sp. GOD-10R]|uniref:TetR/AcrR family transcriptional regulator n=1 Tax=Hymenobacter sp. GOD-10R TaxID=3093922 RepID=UPI002D78FA8A|nr:TetR/AcrR family transcriptional regulator [Hymenobacter sp. GOD-10R]WRQ31873.1 TetR/AcrR family transcriptional regulator [Hymenobacter sp. GOD-10R]